MAMAVLLPEQDGGRAAPESGGGMRQRQRQARHFVAKGESDGVPAAVARGGISSAGAASALLVSAGAAHSPCEASQASASAGDATSARATTIVVVEDEASEGGRSHFRAGSRALSNKSGHPACGKLCNFFLSKLQSSTLYQSSNITNQTRG